MGGRRGGTGRSPHTRQKEGGLTWGKHGFPNGSEPKASDAHAAALSVQRSSAEPQVSPAPIPVISTSFPGWSRPSAAASPRASGIEPDEVLPYRSTLITTRSD